MTMREERSGASGYRVMARRCDQCLYSPDKIVSDRRRKEILREVRQRDNGFLCHKGTIRGEDIYCAGDWETRHCGQLGHIMGRLNAVTFVDPDDYADAELIGRTMKARTPASGMEAAKPARPALAGLDPQGDSPTGEAGDAQKGGLR